MKFGMEAPSGFEPLNEGFADPSLNHLGTAPRGRLYLPTEGRAPSRTQAVSFGPWPQRTHEHDRRSNMATRGGRADVHHNSMTIATVAAVAAVALAVSSQEELPPTGTPSPSGPIRVEVVKTGDRWELRRGGQPYVIRGVGGTGRMELLRSLGGNTVRTWGADNAQAVLDEAYRHGLTVALGIWLGHRSYFDYSNHEQVREQYENARQIVERYRNHPALLMWGLGNEMEIDNDTPELWRAINDLAKMVKELDPNHPTMTVVAEITPQKIRNIKTYAPEVDILGVNSYGGLATLPDRLREFGWDKPWVVTEFGPLGPWERPRTSWGAALEQTSTEKAALYGRMYAESIAAHRGWNLGSFAFLWGEKQEATPTWFGMFLKSGEATEAVDVMSYAWTGRWPEQRAPQVHGFEFSAFKQEVAPGTTLTANVRASDPNGDPLTYRWIVRREVAEERFAGEGEVRPEEIKELPSTGERVQFPAPTEPGNYRLYVYVLDGTGRAGTANLPFRVVRG